MARQTIEVERKLHNSHYDHNKKGWDFHKEQHIMESLADHWNSGIDDGTKVCHFLQGIKSAE